MLVDSNSTFTIAGLSLLDILTGKKWRFGIFNWIDEISGNLQNENQESISNDAQEIRCASVNGCACVCVCV